MTAHAGLEDRVYGAPGAWDLQRCTNPGCGVYWLDPAPAPDDLAIAYRDYHTHEADPETDGGDGLLARATDAFVARRLGTRCDATPAARILGRLVPLLANRAQSALYAHFYLPVRPGGRLLEVGCGSGAQLQTLQRDGWQVSGLDFDPAAVAAARSRGLDVTVGDVRDLALPAARFDAIVMAQLIEHVYDPPGLLKECARLLKPGGRLVAITPNAEALGHRVYGRDWRGLEPPRHLVVYTARGLRVACAHAGLQVEHLEATARDAANLFLVSARIRHMAARKLIQRQKAGDALPIRYRLLAALEQAGKLCGLGWGEELVLTARK